jgi:hypothetical protein
VRLIVLGVLNSRLSRGKARGCSKGHGQGGPFRLGRGGAVPPGTEHPQTHKRSQNHQYVCMCVPLTARTGVVDRFVANEAMFLGSRDSLLISGSPLPADGARGVPLWCERGDGGRGEGADMSVAWGAGATA